LLPGLGHDGWGPGGCGDGSCGACCVPGRTCVAGVWPDSRIGRVLAGLHDCLCCDDPCYEPHWEALADSAFFVDAARPQTQMRLRWDAGFSLKHPDRAEFFWPRQLTIPNQAEAPGNAVRHGFGKGPRYLASRVDYQELSLYTEGASGNIGVFTETPYREVMPVISPLTSQAEMGMAPARGDESGFGDLTIGTKSLLLDTELLLLTFQFKTFIPIADFTKGFGTAHVSLEPSFLWNLRLTCATYMQGQISYWIPVGGDDLYQGNIFHLHFSFNHVLWRPLPDVYVIGTVEFNEWSILGGNYTASDFLVRDPTMGNMPKPVPVTATTAMFSMGPGARLFFCDKIDIGVGASFAITGDRWAQQLIRTEFRWRF
jgi:hypothetical protein